MSSINSLLTIRGHLGRLLNIRFRQVITGRQHSDQCCSNTEGEKKLVEKLRDSFPKALDIHVHDVSGGCGSMYEVHIIAEEFRGSRTIAQHRMVNDALKDEIKNMHGLRISTSVPDNGL